MINAFVTRPSEETTTTTEAPRSEDEEEYDEDEDEHMDEDYFINVRAGETDGAARAKREAVGDPGDGVPRDPLFGIPLAGVMALKTVPKKSVVKVSGAVNSTNDKLYTRRQWRPEASSLSPDGRRCPVDCYWNPSETFLP